MHAIGDHAVHIGCDLLGIAFIPVQNAIRYLGAVQRLKYTKQDPAWAAALVNAVG
jgi:hypothetical protein